jgi:hypothetical protein
MSDYILPDDYDVTPDQLSGKCGTKPRIAPVGSLTFASAATFPLIPRAEWGPRIAEMTANKSRLSDLVKRAGIKSFNQSSTNYCHANSPALAIMALRETQGQPLVLLSPASVGGPITNFKNEGAFIVDDLRQITTGGCASQEFVPPNQIGLSGFKAGWKEDALKYRVEEWWDLGSRNSTMFDRCMTLALSRIPICVAYNWWGHAVTIIDPYQDANGNFGFRERNSWGDEWPTANAGGWFILMEGKGTPDEAYAPRSIRIAA